MDAGIQQAGRTAPVDPMPTAWLGRADAPLSCPDWAVIPQLSGTQARNLLAQIAYSTSAWNYNLVGVENQLGRYQVSTQIMEQYSLLTAGSNVSYGIDCVNYRHCWRAPISNYDNYLQDVTSKTEFLNNFPAQEFLSYQRLQDLYNASARIGLIKTTDTADMVAGLLYVAWYLGVGTAPNQSNSSGTGTYAWRYFNVGDGAKYYVSGRYSVTVLGK